MELKNILFSTLNWPNPNKIEWLKEIEKINESYWFKDIYRNCDLLPLLTNLGLYKPGETWNIGSIKMDWTPFTPANIKVFLNKHILSMLSPKPRIFLIRTFPNQVMKEHIDCNKKSFGSLQLKIRLNITGLTSNLYFLTKNGNLKAPNHKGFFIMDGSWPHGLKNHSKSIRYTLALGSPWTGENLHQKFLQKIIYKPKALPNNYENFFEN